MVLTKETKKGFFKKFGKSETDTGSTEAQIALHTQRINHLTGHLKAQKKDHNTELSLVRLVGKRRSLLNYLEGKNVERYRKLLVELDIRK